MSYPFESLTLTMTGNVANGADYWSCGLHIAGTESQDAIGTFALLALPGEMTNLANIVADYIDEPALKVPSGVTLESIKVAHIGTDGKYVQAALEVEKFAQGNLNASYIPQAAIVNTLDSGKWKDPGKYNRFYLPVALGGNGDNWCLTQAEQEAYAAVTANFIGELNDYFAELLPGADCKVVVASFAGAGSLFPVATVRIGRVVDNQRRRRNAITENYVDEPVVSI